MKSLRRAVAGAAVLAAVLTGAAWKTGEAQSTKKNANATTANKGATDNKEKETTKRDPARRVPRHFGKVGLTSDQKERIYRIQAKHHEKIAELQKQLDQLRAEMNSECEAVLTPEQKKLLERLRKPGSNAAKETDKTVEAK